MAVAQHSMGRLGVAAAAYPCMPRLPLHAMTVVRAMRFTLHAAVLAMHLCMTSAVSFTHDNHTLFDCRWCLLFYFADHV
jgi:hypothetical protein